MRDCQVSSRGTAISTKTQDYRTHILDIRRRLAELRNSIDACHPPWADHGLCGSYSSRPDRAVTSGLPTIRQRKTIVSTVVITFVDCIDQVVQPRTGVLLNSSPMSIKTGTTLRLGSSLVALSYAVAGFAAYSILATRPDINTRSGRHLLAGALAIASLSAVEVLIAIFPLSKGERWAFWAALLPLVTLVLPVMLVDATHVISGNRFTTIVPFAVGLTLAIGGLVLIWFGRET